MTPQPYRGPAATAPGDDLQMPHRVVTTIAADRAIARRPTSTALPSAAVLRSGISKRATTNAPCWRAQESRQKGGSGVQAQEPWRRGSQTRATQQSCYAGKQQPVSRCWRRIAVERAQPGMGRSFRQGQWPVESRCQTADSQAISILE
jgi:hypothetical protein